MHVWLYISTQRSQAIKNVAFKSLVEKNREIKGDGQEICEATEVLK